jgi:hypothetical protein
VDGAEDAAGVAEEDGPSFDDDADELLDDALSDAEAALRLSVR